MSGQVPRTALGPAPAPVPPAGDSAHARHAGFRPPPCASASRSGRLSLLQCRRRQCRASRAPSAVPLLAGPGPACRARPLPQLRPGPPARRRQILPGMPGAPPRQRPQGRPQTPPASAKQRSLRRMRRQARKTRPAALRGLQPKPSRHEPPAPASPQGRTETSRPLRAVRRQGARRRQGELRGLPDRAPPGPSRPCRETTPSGRPLGLHRVRPLTPRSGTPPLCGLPAAYGKTRQGGRQTPPGSQARRRPLRCLRTGIRRSRAHGLRSLPRRLAGPLQPQGPRPCVERPLPPVRHARARGGLRFLPVMQGQAPRRISGQMASQDRRLPRPGRLHLLCKAAARPRFRLLHELP